jgi:hypothetical protein
MGPYNLSKNLNDAPEAMQLLEPTTLTCRKHPFISSLLGFAPGGLRQIPCKRRIPEIFASLDYITSQTVFDMAIRNAIDYEKRHQRSLSLYPPGSQHPTAFGVSLGKSTLQ